MFHKIGTPLHFCNNILPCGPISIIAIPNCLAGNLLEVRDAFTYLTFRYSLKIVTWHARLAQRTIIFGLARETVELLKVETPDFIPPNLWPPNSPDLNPVDYKIWGLLQEQVYKTSIKDVDELRRRIAAWGMGHAGPAHNWWSSCRVAKGTSSVCGCRWMTVWTQNVNIYHFWYFVSEFSDPTLWNTACFVQ